MVVVDQEVLSVNGLFRWIPCLLLLLLYLFHPHSSLPLGVSGETL